jgi:hypothetical protein
MNPTRTFALALGALAALAAAPSAPAAPFALAQPIVLTSAGQSADVTIASMLFKKLNVPVKSLPAAKAADLEGAKSLVVVAGFSSKGLGSAGINREQEMERVKSVLAAAKEKGIRVLVLHLGGKARRGVQSDEFNTVAANAAGALVVVKAGDEDQLFSRIAAEKKIPIDLVEKISDAGAPISKMLQ